MIELKSFEQIEKIRRASEMLVGVLRSLKDEVHEGVTTESLDEFARKMIIAQGGRPAFLGYHGYPKSICTSINEEIVHGIPGKRTLKSGDIISVDAGVELDGFFSDAAVTIGVGKISDQDQKLIDVTMNALIKAIDAAKAGNRISDISHAIQQHAEENSLSVIREFVGHGIGSKLHESPQIPNFGYSGMGPRIKTGMALAIEPMISAGGWRAEILQDGWTAVTKDLSRCAHFEHTVAVTDKGTEVLTEGIF